MRSSFDKNKKPNSTDKPMKTFPPTPCLSPRPFMVNSLSLNNVITPLFLNSSYLIFFCWCTTVTECFDQWHVLSLISSYITISFPLLLISASAKRILELLFLVSSAFNPLIPHFVKWAHSSFYLYHYYSLP